MSRLSHKQKLYIIVGIAAVAVVLQYLLHLKLYAQILVTLVGAIIALSMFKEMVHTLRSGKYGVDLLAILAVVATLSVGEYWASMVILIMLTGGDTLEDYASHKANTELKALLDNSPQIAHKIMDDGDIDDVSVNDVKVGDKIVVKPGEIESKPVEKNLRDNVMSGSLNGDNSVTLQVSKLAKDSQYQQLVKLVKEAESTPAHFVRMADRYAVPFTLAAILISLAAWFFSGDPHRLAEVLVVASPCPLILAAPVAMVSGMSRASRNGIVVKTGDVLEKLATAKTGAFDKTGTITSGQLTVQDVVTTSSMKVEELLQLAASAEQESSHILARSLVAYTDNQNIDLAPVSSLEEKTGKGIEATINHKNVKVGKLKFIAPNSEMKPLATTTIYVSVDDELCGYVTFTDHVRPEAKETMNTLKALGVKKLMMLTGDQEKIAQRVAKEVGIDEVKADLLPQDKITALQNIPKSGHPTFMVGDGVNDAPSLATVDVGIAMGAHGSTAASESADVVILKDDLSRVSKAVTISRDTIKVARQSVLLGIAICTALMLIASTGIIPAFIGAMFQEVVDTVSILWALKARYSHEQ